MKKYIISIFKILCIGSILISSTSSCDDMIKEKSYAIIVPGDVDDSDEGAQMWVTGTYSKLLDDMFRWNLFPTVIEFDCDYITGPDWAFKEFGAGNFQGGGGDADALWEKPYNLIHRANFSIENINKMSNVEPRLKENLIGELKFIKAYGYFLLVRAYGEIPIRKESINATGATNLPRESLDKVWGHIIELLTDAQTMMYKNTDKEYTPGRAAAGTAAALLAKSYATIASSAMPSGEIIIKAGKPYTINGNQKVYTDPTPVTINKNRVAGYEAFNYKEYYKLARIQAEKVIGGEYGEYDLLDYDQLWKLNQRNKSEHMFNIQGVSGDDFYGTNFSKGYAGLYNAQGQIQNGLWYGLRQHWYQLFESKDYRVSKGVMHRWQRSYDAEWKIGSFYPDNEEYRRKVENKEAPYNDGLDYVSNKDAAFIAFLTKYDDRSDKKIERADASWPLLRFADLLLIHAEAAAEEAGTPNESALASLNKVRERSNATPKRLTGNDNIGSIVAFRSAVLEERAMELALEGDRRWDLTRWGIYIEAMNSIGGTDESGVLKTRVKNKHELFPIPLSEMNTNANIGENNPGWS